FQHHTELGIGAHQIIAAGASAGGHLALATAVLNRANTDPRRRPAALMLLNPVSNTVDPYPRGWGREFFASDEEALDHSPYHHIQAGVPPTLIMHGTSDKTVNFISSQLLTEKLLRAGGNASLISYEGRLHSFFRPHPLVYTRDYYETTRQLDLFLQDLQILTPPQNIRPAPDELVANPGFEHDLAHWSAPNADLRLVAEPVHAGRQSVRVTSGASGAAELRQDVTQALGDHGPGECMLSAWLARAEPDETASSRAELGVAELVLQVRGAQDAQPREFTVTGSFSERLTRVAGVTRVTWSGQLRAAHLIVRSDVGGGCHVDDASVGFLPAQIGRWGFDDASDVAADSSGFRRHGTVSGAERVSEGPARGYLRFGGDGMFTVPGVPDPSDHPFTLSAWVRPARGSGGADRVIAAQVGFTDQAWLFLDGATGRLGATLTGSRLLTDGLMRPDRWNHVGLVWDGKQVKLYLNARPAAHIADPPPPSKTELRFGHPGASGGPMLGWMGSIDEIQISDYAVDPRVFLTPRGKPPRRLTNGGR
ncbi:MAG: LamG-like jellyroll fold domain-containing protein, partial [Micromonosporaceae bacterium]